MPTSSVFNDRVSPYDLYGKYDTIDMVGTKIKRFNSSNSDNIITIANTVIEIGHDYIAIF
jgi:hypothetical protein